VAGLLDELALRVGGVLQAVEHGVEAGGQRHQLGRTAVEAYAAAEVGGLDVLSDGPDPVDRAHRPPGPPPRQGGGRGTERGDGPARPRRPAGGVGRGGGDHAVARLDRLVLGGDGDAEQQQDRQVDGEEAEHRQPHPQRPPGGHDGTRSR
jgi:hypothetical protein